MDQAIEPDRKSKPRWALVVLVSTLVALFVSILWVFIQEAAARAKTNPEHASRLETLRVYLRWK
jgi:uncharacterized protein involved in exopolysaccharide biosynthesis